MTESPGTTTVLAAAPRSLGLFVVLVLLCTVCLHLLAEPFVTDPLHTVTLPVPATSPTLIPVDAV